MYFSTSSLSHLLPALLVSSLVSAVPAPQAPTGAPACDPSNEELLQRGSDPELPSPSPDEHPTHIVLGLGTQNYTCQTASDAPEAAGALADLYDISCLLTRDPTQQQLSKDGALGQIRDGKSQIRDGESGGQALGLSPTGIHYFTADGIPFFDLRLNGGADYGEVELLDSVPAAVILGIEGAVDWLRLGRIEGTEGSGIKHVYRVATLGGEPPETCEGLESEFQIQYVAQYWVYN